ncbi:transposase [Rickettsia argasii]|uniref:transposase n=1 Tax=Rickettsia argasii TaxID=1441385 RepID=UPI0009E4FF43
METEKNKKINEAIDLLIEGGADLKTVLSQNGLIKELTKGILARALQAEMSEHLGYSKYDRAGTENARNGSFSKNLISENGSIELNIPRDRQGKFEPLIVSKKQTRIDGLEQKIISLYAKGMNLSDIKSQLQEL